MLQLLQAISKWGVIISFLLLLLSLLYKDRLPDPDHFEIKRLVDPVQESTFRSSFWIEAEGERYQIKPLYDYTLEGVVVSFHDADSFGDIWHHSRWKDFLNVRDLCVIWGANVSNGVYQEMSFDNDSWTCWAYWSDAQTGANFHMTQLSNNHLLVDDDYVKEELMSAEPGDHIRISGHLASYENPSNNFKRGSSTRRDDVGNGACETIYVENFEIVSKANVRWRGIYTFSGWSLGLFLTAFMVLFFITPPARKPSIY
ncbi:MAG: hypothetical protein B6D77_11555 [gamma proteobacterium symbiont of Ctena orbiculata]|nr:MAG: hypothetical protein B6D77_11555 [gamma proteobacterium symbiont of Ctena orbiculata]PVV20012.1 MAG: hypothetical protein B6D78_11860 [gamma proteobacterium symbiont of Ctena orbiculata]